MSDITAPIDELHRQCIVERDNIRREVASAISRVRRWSPAPITKESEET
jgi:hypothetical protein